MDTNIKIQPLLILFNLSINNNTTTAPSNKFIPIDDSTTNNQTPDDRFENNMNRLWKLKMMDVMSNNIPPNQNNDIVLNTLLEQNKYLVNSLVEIINTLKSKL